MPRFAANLGYLFTEHDFLDRFAAARRAGFRAVEFAAPYAYPPEEIAMRLLDNALECILINLPMGDRAKGDFGIACRPGREAEFRAGVARGIEYAHALGVPRLNCISGIAPGGDDREPFRATLIANLRLAAREFKAAGLELVVEPINTRDVPGFIVARSPEAVAIIEEVGADNLGGILSLQSERDFSLEPDQLILDYTSAPQTGAARKRHKQTARTNSEVRMNMLCKSVGDPIQFASFPGNHFTFHCNSNQ